MQKDQKLTQKTVSIVMKKVVIAIPAYNEADNLERNILHINKVLSQKKVLFNWEIIIAENGSTDKTYEIAKKLARNYKRVKATHYDRGSKDNAIIETWLKSKVDIMIFTDADNSADPRYILDLVKTIEEGSDIATGYRFHTKLNSRGLYRDTISRIYNNIILPTILPTGTNDTQCGFKAINKKVLREVVPKLSRQNGFFDTELLGVAFHKGFKIKEVPITWKETRKSVLSVNKNIPNFLKNLLRTRIKLARGGYD